MVLIENKPGFYAFFLVPEGSSELGPYNHMNQAHDIANNCLKKGFKYEVFWRNNKGK